MASKVEVIGLDAVIRELRTKVKPIAKTAMTEIMEDLRRCASGFAPKDTGHLEQSGRVNVRETPNQVIGEVTYSVTADDINYALLMHEGFYNLGPKSQAKSGGTSKFGTVSHSVGRKYLSEPFHQLLPAYCEHIAYVIGKRL